MAHKNGTNWGKPGINKYWPVEKYENLFSLSNWKSGSRFDESPVLAPKKRGLIIINFEIEVPVNFHFP